MAVTVIGNAAGAVAWDAAPRRQVCQRDAGVAFLGGTFVHVGHPLKGFSAYLAARIRIGIGTDTSAHRMLEELRKASSLARIAASGEPGVASISLTHIPGCA